jgi:hypothetical protein
VKSLCKKKGNDMGKANSTVFIDVNIVPGTLRDSWGIVRKGMPPTETNQPGEQLIEMIPGDQGYDAVTKRLREISSTEGVRVARAAWHP